MKEAKKQERANQKALDWLAKMGKNVEEIKVEPVAVVDKRFPPEHSLEMEACLKYWDNPTVWIEKKCQYCGKTFATLYYPIGNCSDACRIKQLRDIGIDYNPRPGPDHRKWGRVPQMTVPPEALTFLKELRDEKTQTLQHDEPLLSETQSTDDSRTDLDSLLHESIDFSLD